MKIIFILYNTRLEIMATKTDITPKAQKTKKLTPNI